MFRFARECRGEQLRRLARTAETDPSRGGCSGARSRLQRNRYDRTAASNPSIETARADVSGPVPNERSGVAERRDPRLRDRREQAHATDPRYRGCAKPAIHLSFRELIVNAVQLITVRRELPCG